MKDGNSVTINTTAGTLSKKLEDLADYLDDINSNNEVTFTLTNDGNIIIKETRIIKEVTL